MLCEWERVRGEHPPPILARAPSGARAFIFSRHPLSARWACVLSGTLASPRPGALTVCLATAGTNTGPRARGNGVMGVFFIGRARTPLRAIPIRR